MEEEGRRFLKGSGIEGFGRGRFGAGPVSRDRHRPFVRWRDETFLKVEHLLQDGQDRRKKARRRAPQHEEIFVEPVEHRGRWWK